jgi:hypothetical protein
MNVMDFLICIYQQMHRIGAGFNSSNLSISWHFAVYNLSAPCNNHSQGIHWNCGIIWNVILLMI